MQRRRCRLKCKHFCRGAVTLASLIVILHICTRLLYSGEPQMIFYQFNDTVNATQRVKTILYWTEFYDEKHFGFGVGRQPFLDANCKMSNCELWDRYDGTIPFPYEQFDCLLFHMIDFKYKPPIRSSHQRYTLFLMESPTNRFVDYTDLNNFFNWTITYRRDSDIYLPYGYIVEKNTSSDVISPAKAPVKWLTPTYEDMVVERPWTVSSKTKMIAWPVSHCSTASRREDYVDELSKYVEVDIYGNCGSLKCSRWKESCYTMLEETYKFYLSFENSLCEDYVTEKLFRIMEINIVPIVYGGADYKKSAPPMSYIDTGDFADAKELATYLNYLDKHPEEYEKYFWWKQYYKIDVNWTHMLCDVCEKLNDPNEPDVVYSDVGAWWNGPGTCKEPTIA